MSLQATADATDRHAGNAARTPGAGDGLAAADAALVCALRVYAQYAAVAAAVLGAAVLLGWAFEVQALKSVLPALPTMKANTALGLTFTGVALWLLHPARTQSWAARAGQGCAMAALLIGGATLAEYIGGWNLGVDQILFNDDAKATATAAPGRPSPMTALEFVLLGAGLLLIRADLRGRRPAQVLGVAAVLVGSLGFMSYLYGATMIRLHPGYTSMALHTAIGFLMLATGLLAVDPDRGLMRQLTLDSAGGLLARRLIPTVIVFSVTLGWLRLTAQRAGLIDTEFGVVIMVSAVSMFVTGATVIAARAIDRVDLERRRAAQQAWRANRELEAAGQRLTLALRAGEIGIWDWDIRSNQITWNAQMHELYGTAPGLPVSYATWRDAVLPEDLAQAEATLQKTIEARGASDNHFRIRHPRKGIRHIAASEEPFVDEHNTVIRVVGVNKDVTEQKLLEEHLRASEERMRLSFDHSAVGAAIVSMTGRWLTVNRALCEMVGYAQPELLATDFQTITHPDDLGGDLALVQHLVAGDIPSYQLEKRYLHKQGQIVWVRLSAALVRDASGAPLHFVVHIENITERKHAEQRAASASKELEAFSYSVAHDLRAPLRGINGFSQILLRSHAPQMNEDAKECLAQITSSSRRMGQLIDDLLSLAKVGRAELRREDVDLSGMAQGIADHLRQGAPERDAEFFVEGGLHVQADSRLLMIVLENLIGNAWKYTGKHSRARIEVGSVRDHGQTSYYVRDDGDGFDMAYAGKLFGAFQRLHSSEDFEGTGIGLATVQRIVQRHGGTVRAEGKPGAGATFYFTLG